MRRIGERCCHRCRRPFPWQLILALLVLPSIAWAQLPSDASSGSARAKLGESGSPTRITGGNYTEFRELVLPEVVPLLKSGFGEMSAVQKLEYSWRYDDSWTQAAATSVKLAPENGGLAGPPPLERGLAFGDSSVIGREADPVRQGQEILWNIQSVFWSERILQIPFRLEAYTAGRLEQRFSGELSRVYPTIVNSADKTGQTFREKVQLTLPPPISPISWLTFRFYSDEEDFLWMFSPALQKVRQLTGSNRSDSLIGTSLSLDDLLGWSGKPNTVTARVEGEGEYLAAVPSVKLGWMGASSKPCLEVKVDADSGLGESPPRVQAGPESGPPGDAVNLFAGVKFVPREMYRVELTTKDPYSRYGRQILFVDKAQMLPAYKIVYDRAGKLWKVIISAFGMAITPDRQRKFPYPAFLLIEDAVNSKISVLKFGGSRYCDSFPEGQSMTDFDPRQLGGGAKDKEKDKQPA